jgi:hypothetical protein
MTTLQGIAIKVRNTLDVSSSGGENSQTSTTHISVFQLNAQPVQVLADSPVMIDEGDTVLVAGQVKNGGFKAFAYQNVTTGVHDSAGWILNVFIGSLFAIGGLLACVSIFGSDWGPVILGLPFLLIGSYAAHGGFSVLSAIKELKAARAYSTTL